MIDKANQTQEEILIDTTARKHIDQNGLRLHGTEVICDGKGIVTVDVGNLRYEIGLITINSMSQPVFVPARETKAELIESNSDDN